MYRKAAYGDPSLGCQSYRYPDDRLRHERPSGRRAEGCDSEYPAQRHGWCDASTITLRRSIFWMERWRLVLAYHYFPARTIHLVVVDPGAGTQRAAEFWSAAINIIFVAPDNGVLSMVYEREQNVLVRHITAGHYFLSPISNTFHGRDIFAPVAAANGWARSMQTEAFGEEITDYVRFSIPRPTRRMARGLKGVVLRVDTFGNLLTNFTAVDLPAGSTEEGKVQLKVGGKGVQRFVQTFCPGVRRAKRSRFLDPADFLEVAMNEGEMRGAYAGAVNRGAEVIFGDGVTSTCQRRIC